MRDTELCSDSPRCHRGVRPLRAAYVCADPGVPVFGSKGCSIHVQEVVRALKQAGTEVELFAARFDGPPPRELEDVGRRQLPCAREGSAPERENAALQANGFLWEALEQSSGRPAEVHRRSCEIASGEEELGGRQFDLVYERYSLWSCAGIEFAASRKVPGLLEVNAPLLEEQKRHRELHYEQQAREMMQRAFRAATRLLAVSDEVASYLSEFPEARGKVSVIPNGVDPVRFPQGLEPTFPRSTGEFIVGFVGSLKPWHGLSVLAEAFALLYQKRPRARLLIVGEGPERAMMLEQLRESGALQGALFTGNVPAEEVPGLIAAMDVAVAPYPDSPEFYFSPLKVYEYMAAGRAVVASRIGQLRQLIRHRENGWLVPPGEPQALAAALEALWDNDALRTSLGLAARQQALEHHTWQAVAERILQMAGVNLLAPVS